MNPLSVIVTTRATRKTPLRARSIKPSISPILPISLISKLGSMIVHLQEFLSEGSHEFDIETLRQLVADPEVEGFLKDIDPALLPVKRG